MKKVPFRARLGWTVVSLGVLLLMKETPIYGIAPPTDEDMFYYLRPHFLSSPGKVLYILLECDFNFVVDGIGGVSNHCNQFLFLFW